MIRALAPLARPMRSPQCPKRVKRHPAAHLQRSTLRNGKSSSLFFFFSWRANSSSTSIVFASCYSAWSRPACVNHTPSSLALNLPAGSQEIRRVVLSFLSGLARNFRPSPHLRCQLSLLSPLTNTFFHTTPNYSSLLPLLSENHTTRPLWPPSQKTVPYRPTTKMPPPVPPPNRSLSRRMGSLLLCSMTRKTSM